MNEVANISERVLILTPTGNDAANALIVLEQAGLNGAICPDCPDLEAKFAEGTGALLVAEEALTPDAVDCLLQMLAHQPPWSDVPLLLITSAAETDEAGQTLLNTFAPNGNITLIERPVRPISLVSVLRVVLRARRRQYQLRGILEEQQRNLANIQEKERKLRASEERYRSLFQSIDEGFCLIEMLFDEIEKPVDYRFLEINPAFEQHTGLHDAGGKTMREMLPEQDPHWFEIYGRVAKTGEGVRFENYSEPMHRWFNVYAFRVGGPEERKVALLFSNITERKQAEEALREAHEQLASRAKQLESLVQQRTTKLTETIRELEGFSYSITHDMRAPLRAVNSFSQMLAEEYGAKLDENGKDLLDRIQQSVTRMDKLIQDVLQYSRVLRMDLKLEPVNADRLVSGMIDSYPDFQEPQVTVRIEGELPAVLANEAALTQCFSNLLNNAVKFVSPGTKPHVTVRGVNANSKVRFWIEDNGIGIEPKYLETIFGLFQRLTKDYEGTGVGLSIVSKAVERMGGTIGAESELGKGSRFWFELNPANGERKTP